MVMATSAQQMVEELKEVQKYLESQRALLGEDAMQQQAEVWVSKIQGTLITAQEAVDIINLIKTGPWNEGNQKKLGMAVNSAVLASSNCERQRRCNQDCSDFTKYFSTLDLKVLQDPLVPSQRKLEQVACRMRAVGLHLPSETTMRHIFSVSLKAGLQCQQDAYSLSTTLRELKRLLKACCKHAQRPRDHIVKYPGSPQELPEWLFQSAYDPTDPPVSLEITTAEIAGQAAAVALRKNSKLLPQNQQHMQAGPMVPMVNGGQPGQCDPMSAMQQMFTMMMAQMFQGASQPEVPSLHFMKPQDKKSLKALPPPALPIPPADPAPLALTNGASSAVSPEMATPARVTAADPKIETPAPKALMLPEMSPESQVKTVAAATLGRKDARDAAKENDVKIDPKAKAKGAAKSKAKSKAKAKAKATAVAKGKAKTTKAEAKGDPPIVPEAVAREALPPIMKLGDPTVLYRGGKLHRNSDCFRVFVKASDRCDRKVRIREGQEQECWLKALGIIDARLDAVDVS